MLRPLTWLLLALLGTCGRAQVTYFPPQNEATWEQTDPGYDPDSVAALYRYLEDTQTKGFILLQDGKIALEKYFGTFVQDSVWYWASAGKSLRATLVGIAQEEGHLAITDTISRYLGVGWTNLPPEREAAITVWHQLTMTAGLNELFFSCTEPNCLRYLAPVGERWAYHNSPYSLTKEVLEAATELPLNAYTNRTIEQPLGMKSGVWLANGYNTMYFSRVRDAARFGHLILAGGKWDQTTVLGDTEYFAAMTSPSQALNPAYGYLWWLNGQENYLLPGERTIYPGPTTPAAPDDLIVAAGKNGQFIAVVPSTGTVMVRFGEAASDDYAPLAYHNSIWERLVGLRGTTATRASVRPEAVSSFPNPTGRFVRFRLPAGQYQYALFDGRGRRCRLGTTNGRIDLQGLPAGVYTARLRSADQLFVGKLVKR
ncbi:MAG: serine hydrolase [Bacteroidota bacterium]